MIDIYEIDKMFKSFNIDEANFTIKDNEDTENKSFYYCNLDDDEFQIGEDGGMITNYVTTKHSDKDEQEV